MRRALVAAAQSRMGGAGKAMARMASSQEGSAYTTRVAVEVEEVMVVAVAAASAAGAGAGVAAVGVAAAGVAAAGVAAAGALGSSAAGALGASAAGAEALGALGALPLPTASSLNHASALQGGRSKELTTSSRVAYRRPTI